jgi:alkylation response protein AidB-like acyl-CoA dehydrogenase
VPERFGGTEQGLVELVLVAEELGRAAAAGPFVPTALVARAVGRAGSAAVQAAVLPNLAEGGAAATLALAEPGASGRRPAVAVCATADGYTLSGTKTAVQDAERARWLLVTALVADEPALLLVDAAAPGVSIRRQQGMDLTRAFCEVRFADVVVAADRLLGGGPAEVALLLDAAAVLTAADALGAMEHLLALTVGHVTTRRQFDRPIGSFQAVKQAAATMAIDVHATSAAVQYAAMAADAVAPDAARSAAAAAAFVGPAARRVAGWALQLHGGLGFTWEHDLHLYLRRATVDAVLHGDPTAHDDRLVTLLQN